MNIPIKPPGSKPPVTPEVTTGVPSTSAPKSTSFKDVIAREPQPSEATQKLSFTGRAEDIVQQLRSGQIDANGAVEKLVERALSGKAAQSLGPAKRKELESFLRKALADDPTLSTLAKDMERVR